MEFFIGVIIGVAIGFYLGYMAGKQQQTPVAPPVFIPCPNCTEPVRSEASVCKHCHRSLAKGATA